MLIGDKLEIIRYTLVTFSKNFENYSAMTRRLLAIGVVTELTQLNKQLEELCLRLESEISVEDAEIAFDDWLTNKEWINGEGIFNILSYHQQENKDIIISHMTDYLPVGAEGFSYMAEQAEAFKTGMHQFCDEESICACDIIYAIDRGIKYTIQLLSEVKRKKTNIPSYLFEDYWYSFVTDYSRSIRTADIYEHWKEEHDDPDFDMLKDKQMQEILVLLKSGFLSHAAVPTRREIQNSSIKLNKEAFDRNTIIPDDVDLECARFSKFAAWKEETILMINYEKLGKYIYKHYKDFSEKEKKRIVHFDMMMDMIHEDMASMDPKYKIYLKNYEGDEMQHLYDTCVTILMACNVHLAAGVGDDFFGRILSDVMYGDMKTELKSKLGGASRMTTLCAILAACKNSSKVFKIEVISDDLATTLATVVDKPSKDSLKRYIENGSANYRARIYVKTEAAIKNYLSNIHG